MENIVRKGEIACHKQFLLFSQHFSQQYIFSVLNAALCGNGLTLYHTITSFDDPEKDKKNENNTGQGEKTDNHNFRLSPQ